MAPDAAGFTLGAPASEGERFAAVLSGVAFVERPAFDCLNLLGAPVDGPISLTGGATKSAYWCQLRTDVPRRPVTLPEPAEPAPGMAALAAAPGRDPAMVAAAMVRAREVIEPRVGTEHRHDAGYLALIGELRNRGWLQPPVADHAEQRTTDDHPVPRPARPDRLARREPLLRTHRCRAHRPR